MAGVRRRSPARHRPDEPAVEGVKDGWDLVVLGQEPVGRGEIAEQGNACRVGRSAGHLRRRAADQRLDGRTLGLGTVRCLGHREQEVDPLLRRGRLAHHVKPQRDQRVLELEDRRAQSRDAPLGVVAGQRGPGGLARGELEGRGLRLQLPAQLGALACRRLGLQAAPALEHRLQLEQAAVQAGVRDRRREVADQRGARAALGDGALGRVVRRVHVQVRQVADHPVRPARAGHARLLARHELERAVGAEVQHRVRAEVLAQPAVERRERVRRREAALEQQPHRVALVAHARLHADHHVAEALAQHEDRAAVALLAARRRAPLRLDLAQPALAAHVVVGGDPGVDVGGRAVLRGVALQHALAQRLDRLGHVDGVALRLHRGQRVVQRVEHREVGGGADVGALGRVVEQHHRDLARGALGAAHRHQLADPRREHRHALGAHVHVEPALLRAEGAGVVAAGAGRAGGAGAPAEDHRSGRAVELGDRHHDRALDRQQTAVRRAPLHERLELDRVGGEVRHVERGERALGGRRVVVRRAAHQREARQRHHRVDRRPAVLHEEPVDRRTRVEAGREDRHHLQALDLHRRDHAVVVRRVAGQQVRAQQQQADPPLGQALARQPRQLVGTLADAPGHPRVVHADLGVLDGGGRLRATAQTAARAVGIAVDQEADHVVDVLLGAAQPVLQRQEVGAHVLRGARDEAQQLRDPAQHLHLLRAARGARLAAGTAQPAQQRHRAAGGAVHRESAETRELDDLAGRHRAHQRVAVVAARLQRGQHRQEVVLHEQHRRDDDVAAGDVGLAALERVGVVGPLGGSVHAQHEARQLAAQRQRRTLDGARQVGVHRHDDDVHRRAVSDRSALWHHRESPP
jgi:hypothetical protein